MNNSSLYFKNLLNLANGGNELICMLYLGVESEKSRYFFISHAFCNTDRLIKSIGT